MKKSLASLAVLATIVVGLMAAPAGAAATHCAVGLYKVNAVGSNLDSVGLPAGTEFCIKAGTENSSYLTADGTTTLGEYVTWLNGGGQTPSVSYLVVYRECSGYYC